MQIKFGEAYKVNFVETMGGQPIERDQADITLGEELDIRDAFHAFENTLREQKYAATIASMPPQSADGDRENYLLVNGPIHDTFTLGQPLIQAYDKALQTWQEAHSRPEKELDVANENVDTAQAKLANFITQLPEQAKPAKQITIHYEKGKKPSDGTQIVNLDTIVSEGKIKKLDLTA